MPSRYVRLSTVMASRPFSPCVDAACGAEELCDHVCNGRSGVGATGCAAEAPACTGEVAPPLGPDGVTCRCNDDAEIALCAGVVNCGSDHTARDVCAPLCVNRGGLWYDICEPSAMVCAPP